MKSIQFGSAVYKLVSNVNVSQTHFQATILKENNTVEAIAQAASAATEFKILSESGETEAIYTGFTKRVAVNYYHVDNNDVVSVEFENTDLLSAINDLGTAVDSVSATVSGQASSISALSGEIAALTESQDAQDMAIDDLATAVGELEG